MNLDYVGGLLFSSIAITHHNQAITIPNVVVDTGAVESILSIDDVEDYSMLTSRRTKFGL